MQETFSPIQQNLDTNPVKWEEAIYSDSQKSGFGQWVGSMVVTIVLEHNFYDSKIKICSSKGTNLNLPLDHIDKDRWSPVGQKKVGEGA